MLELALPIIISALLLAFAIYVIAEEVRGLRWLLTDFRGKLAPELPTPWQQSRLFKIGVAMMPVISVAGLIFWSVIAFALLCRISKAAMALA